MTPPIATAITNGELDSTPTRKNYSMNSTFSSNKMLNNQKNGCSSISSFLNKAISISTNASLFDTVSIEKSHANQALVDLHKLYDLNGMHINNGCMDQLVKIPEGCIEAPGSFDNENDVDEDVMLLKEKICSTDIKFLNKNVSGYAENPDKNVDLRNEKKNEFGRKLKENSINLIAKEKSNNDKLASKIMINSNPEYICDLSKKSNNFKEYCLNNEIQKMQTVVKSKIKIKTENPKNKAKQTDNINEIANRLSGKHHETLSAKQNFVVNSHYGKAEGSIIRNSIFKSSIDGENVISLNCVNPVQIFPYKLTLKRIKSELSDSEEEIDVVSVNLNKNSNNNCNSKICLQDTSNNIIIIKKSGIKNSIFTSQTDANSEVQVIKNDIINSTDKCSLLADILKTPMSFPPKTAVLNGKKTDDVANDHHASQISTCVKKSLPAIASSKMKYPIHFYSSIKDNNYVRESYKTKYFGNKVLKSNMVGIRRVTKGSLNQQHTNNLNQTKKNLLSNVIQKTSNKKQNSSRKSTSLIITQRSVKVSSTDSIKSLWKNKRLKRKMSDRKFIKKNHPDYLIIADSEVSSIEDNENEESDSRSSTLSNFSSNHSSGWSSPLEYSSGSESFEKSSNIISTLDLNILNEKLSKKASTEKMENNDWALYSNMNDYGFSDTCSSIGSEKVNCSNIDNHNSNSPMDSNGNNFINNSSHGIANSQSGSSLKRNRSYTSGYSSDNPAEKRAFHILSERQRRNDLKKLFETLRTNVPNLSDKQKASKLTILKAAVDFLADISAKQIKLSSAYDKEKQRHLQLIQNLKVLQANMK